MGMARNFPNDALYGSKDYNGFCFVNPYDLQGITKLLLFLQETANKTDTGNWLQATAKGLRLELGFNSSISKIPWNRVKGKLTNY